MNREIADFFGDSSAPPPIGDSSAPPPSSAHLIDEHHSTRVEVAGGGRPPALFEALPQGPTPGALARAAADEATVRELRARVRFLESLVHQLVARDK